MMNEVGFCGWLRVNDLLVPFARGERAASRLVFALTFFFGLFFSEFVVSCGRL